MKICRFGEMDLQSSLRNLTIVAGGSETVGIGGYLTGGGHGALSATYGMGADQVLEMEIVTPRGKILTINECQNQDLFWAMRGVCPTWCRTLISKLLLTQIRAAVQPLELLPPQRSKPFHPRHSR
jgi:FAD/FMN-containing dehydrogenase